MKSGKGIRPSLLLCALIIASPVNAGQPQKHQSPIAKSSLLRPVAQIKPRSIPKGLVIYQSISNYLEDQLAASIHFIKLQDIVKKVWFEQKRNK